MGEPVFGTFSARLPPKSLPKLSRCGDFPLAKTKSALTTAGLLSQGLPRCT
jgi:hypothetical protein